LIRVSGFETSSAYPYRDLPDPEILVLNLALAVLLVLMSIRTTASCSKTATILSGLDIG
jgi:hypothetical protein